MECKTDYPKKTERIFNNNLRIHQHNFNDQRKRIAQRMNNPRILQIHFHTFRHWKATQLYHQAKDILYVKEFLGHKRIDSTLVYINMEKAIFEHGFSDEFVCKVAKTPEEISGLIESGFEYVAQKDGLMYFRKRK